MHLCGHISTFNVLINWFDLALACANPFTWKYVNPTFNWGQQRKIFKKQKTRKNVRGRARTCAGMRARARTCAHVRGRARAMCADVRGRTRESAQNAKILLNYTIVRQ
jgi:hypothetical protein